MEPVAKNESNLLRLLHGELPAEEARALSRRLASEPDLLAAYRRLERIWGGLGPDPGVGPRPGFATALVARAREFGAAGNGLGWSFAPAWAKVVAVLALLIGAALGSVVTLAGSSSAAPPAAASSNAEAALSGELSTEVTLGESYATALQSPDEDVADGTEEVRQ